jgi:hypothetical protein
MLAILDSIAGSFHPGRYGVPRPALACSSKIVSANDRFARLTSAWSV